MPTIKSGHKILSLASASIVLSLTENADTYLLSDGTGATLIQNVAITYSGTPLDNTVFDFYLPGLVDFAGYTIRIFGFNLIQTFSLKKAKLTFRYNTYRGEWDIFTRLDQNDDFRAHRQVRNIVITGSGADIELDPYVDPRTILITGDSNLGVVFRITATDAADGDEFIIIYKASIVLTTGSITILGVSLTDEQALGGDSLILATYYNTGWVTTLLGPFSETAESRSYVRKCVRTITGDGSAVQFTVTHDLGTTEYIVMMYDQIGNPEGENILKEVVGNTQLRVSFIRPPAEGAVYKLIMIG